MPLFGSVKVLSCPLRTWSLLMVLLCLAGSRSKRILVSMCVYMWPYLHPVHRVLQFVTTLGGVVQFKVLQNEPRQGLVISYTFYTVLEGAVTLTQFLAKQASVKGYALPINDRYR